MRGFSGKRVLSILVLALAMCLWGQRGVTLAQTAKPEKPVVKKGASPSKSGNSLSKDEKLSIVNELRRELLDARADFIDRWLAVVAIVLTFFGIIVAIIGIIGFRRFQSIEKEARESIDAAKQFEIEAREHAEEAGKLHRKFEKAGKYAIETFGEKGREVLEGIRREYPDEPKETLQDITAEAARKDLLASSFRKAISNAHSLQRQGNIDKAIEKWRAIADVVEETDKDLATRALFFIGYLFEKQGKYEEAIRAYSKWIYLNPEDPIPYNNRGLLMAARLGQYEAALKDYNEAINQKENYDLAYYNRGIVKDKLGQLGSAIEDFNKTIDLNKDFAAAYCSRGISKATLGRKDEAREDFTIALKLAQKDDDQNIVELVEKELQKLDEK